MHTSDQSHDSNAGHNPITLLGHMYLMLHTMLLVPWFWRSIFWVVDLLDVYICITLAHFSMHRYNANQCTKHKFY